MVHELSEKTVELPGGACSIAEAGAGGRPLLLVHGFSGAKEDFTPWLVPLAEIGWHAVAYDNFGHGASAKPSEVSDYTLAGYRDQLFAVMDAFGWETCALLGHSMGGMIVQEALAVSPNRFEAVVFMDTNHGPLPIDTAYVGFVKQILETSGVQGLLDAGNSLGLFEQAPSTKARYEADPGYRAFNEKKFLSTAAPVFLAMVSELGERPELIETLRSLEISALVVVGEEDAAFLAPSREMAEAVPGCELAVIANGAHCPQFEAEQAWWEAVGGFFTRVITG